MKRMRLLAVIVALSALSHSVDGAGTVVPLNTGFDHWTQLVYVPPPAAISTTRDDYWINLASYPATIPPTDRTFLVRTTGAPWAPPLSFTSGGVTWGSSWISAWNRNASQTIATPSNPAYTLFRKCFCLREGFAKAEVVLKARADDTIQVWLNTQLQTLVPPSWGNWNGTPVSGGTTNQQWFHPGVNCIYVLVEDFRGHMGLNLVGTISAIGLLAEPAKGTTGSFEPCSCERGHGPTGAAPRGVGHEADQEVVNEIIKTAEARRTAKEKIEYRGKQPKK